MRSWGAVLAAWVMVGGSIPSALAQEAEPVPTPTPSPSSTGVATAVTLRSSKNVLTFGHEVRLSGRVEPVVPGAPVRIVEADGTEVASVTPGADGAYSTRLRPEGTLKLAASYIEGRSQTRTIKVRPVLRVSLGRVRLFAKTTVSGTVEPASSTSVKLSLWNNGRARRSMKLSVTDGSFRKRLRITDLGRIRARVSYRPPGMATHKKLSASRRVPRPPNLAAGSTGVAVQRLEWRLRNLGYYLPGTDRHFGAATADAVIAFNKVQGRSRIGSVASSTWSALSKALRARPRYGRGSHIEVDQTRQVILVVRKGKVRWTLHTSTGAGRASRDGTWTVGRKLEGYSPGRLYYPSYYDGLRAVHGWPEVPTYPASHGCARVPMWSATWIHSKMPIGTTVYVYH